MRWREVKVGKHGADKKVETVALRDQFAIAALQGILSSPNCPKIVDEKLVTRGAYLFADAMLAARGPK